MRFGVAIVLFVLPSLLPAAPIEWKTNLETALSDARSTGRPVLLDFYADWCGYCRKLRAEVYPSAEVSSEARKFVAVTVNVDRNQRAAAKYEIEGLPTVLFLDSNGYVLDRIAGFVDARTFARRMRDATRRASTKQDIFVRTEPRLQHPSRGLRETTIVSAASTWPLPLGHGQSRGVPPRYISVGTLTRSARDPVTP